MSIISQINQQSGNKVELQQWAENNVLQSLREIQSLRHLTQRLKDSHSFKSEFDTFLAAIQIVDLYKTNKQNFKKTLKWLMYSRKKRYYQELLRNFSCSKWENAKLKEKLRANSHELCVEFPPANRLSNGQRDVVTLVIRMHKTLYEGSKKPLILVIDEVFDYLDDANLVAFQYYVTQIIEQYRKKKMEVYPLILTHLEPGNFFNYSFNKYKLHIHYLNRETRENHKNTQLLIKMREEDSRIKGDLERFWFHYNPTNKTFEQNEWSRQLTAEWRQSDEFHKYAKNELCKYIQNQSYDPLAICFAVRVLIEQKVYFMLKTEAKKEAFVETNTTRKKLEYAAGEVGDIPEIYYLLGLIYNSNLHWKENCDLVSPLIAKLEHPVIRHIIKDMAGDDFL